VSASPQIDPKLPTTLHFTDRKPPRRTTAKVGDSWCQLAISTPTNSPASLSRPSFGTFGKKAGAAALRELQAGAILSRFILVYNQLFDNNNNLLYYNR